MIVTTLFLPLLRMSISAAWLILAVILLRLILRRAPRRIICLLWLMVALRLVCPFTVESALSLLPRTSLLPVEVQSTPAVMQTVIPSPQLPPTMVIPPSTTDIAPLPTTPAAALTPGDIAAIVWLGGCAVLAGYAVISSLLIRRRVRVSLRLRDNIHLCDSIDTPFILGIFRPVIYLPSTLGDDRAAYVIAHEQAHLARGDHLWKPIGFALLILHWFNPLVWVSYTLFCRDIELACDERVVAPLSLEERKTYSAILLACSVDRRISVRYPLAFGEIGVRARISKILQNTKPTVWMTALAILLCAVTAVCFLTDPRTPASDDPPPPETTAPVTTVPAESTGPETTVPAESTAPVTTAPAAPQTVALTPESAQSFIDAALGSLALLDDSRVTFTLPAVIPTGDDATRLYITLTATYGTGGSYSVQRLLDYADGWTGGQTYIGTLDPNAGELTALMLRVAFMTEIEPNAMSQYAANYVELKAPFANSPALIAPNTVQITAASGLTRLDFSLRGTTAAVTLALPDGFTLTAEPTDVDDLPSLALNQNGTKIGSLSLFPFAAPDTEALSTIDPAQNSLPMPIFATVALSNHAGYTDYTVRRSTATGASATAKYVWQNLTGNVPAAAVPFDQAADSILVYDWSVMPYFVVLTLTEGTLTEAEYIALAQSLTIE